MDPALALVHRLQMEPTIASADFEPLTAEAAAVPAAVSGDAPAWERMPMPPRAEPTELQSPPPAVAAANPLAPLRAEGFMPASPAFTMQIPAPQPSSAVVADAPAAPELVADAPAGMLAHEPPPAPPPAPAPAPIPAEAESAAAPAPESAVSTPVDPEPVAPAAAAAPNPASSQAIVSAPDASVRSRPRHRHLHAPA